MATPGDDAAQRIPMLEREIKVGACADVHAGYLIGCLEQVLQAKNNVLLKDYKALESEKKKMSIRMKDMLEEAV